MCPFLISKTTSVDSWDREALPDATSSSHMRHKGSWIKSIQLLQLVLMQNLLTMSRSSDCDLLMANPHSHKLGVMPCDIWTRCDLPILNAFATGKINYVAVIILIMPAFFSCLFSPLFLLSLSLGRSQMIFVVLEQQMAPVHDLFKSLT